MRFFLIAFIETAKLTLMHLLRLYEHLKHWGDDLKSQCFPLAEQSVFIIEGRNIATGHFEDLVPTSTIKLLQIRL